MSRYSIAQIRRICNGAMASAMIAAYAIAPIGAYGEGYCVIPGKSYSVLPEREPAALVEPAPTDGDFDLWPILPQIPQRQTAALELLACAIYYEAGGNACSDMTRMMVGNVILNRVADPRYPDTIEGVLTEYRQYGRFYWSGVVWPERAAQEPEAVARAYDIARRLLDGERVFDADVIYQSEYKQGEVVAENDGMWFGR
jgi:hypothetical protein